MLKFYNAPRTFIIIFLNKQYKFKLHLFENFTNAPRTFIIMFLNKQYKFKLHFFEKKDSLLYFL